MKRMGSLAAAPIVAAALLTAPGVAASAATVAPAGVSLPCRGTVSNSNPPDNTTVYVNVSTAPDAAVTTDAHFQTGDVMHFATADAAGNASIAYLVGDAAPGYKVVVDVQVADGPHYGNCVTSFIPRR